MSELLKDDEITKERIEGLFKAALLRVERDKDDDLVIRDEGVNTFIKVDSRRKILVFFSIWGLRSRFSDAEKLRFANQLNDDLILVRFTVPRSDMLWCDYQLLYEGGVTPIQIVNTYRKFVSICRGAARKDDMDMIGSD